MSFDPYFKCGKSGLANHPHGFLLSWSITISIQQLIFNELLIQFSCKKELLLIAAMCTIVRLKCFSSIFNRNNNDTSTVMLVCSKVLCVCFFNQCKATEWDFLRYCYRRTQPKSLPEGIIKARAHCCRFSARL